MKSIIVTFVLFFAFVFVVLLIGASGNHDIQNTAWQAQNNGTAASFVSWFPCLTLGVLGFCFMLWVISAASNNSRRYTEYNSMSVGQVVDDEYDPEVERDTFTNEEILQRGIDVRIKSHREHIKAQRRERKNGGMTKEQQARRAKWEGRVEPDSRYIGGKTKRTFTDEDSLYVFQKLFPRARIRYGSGFLGSKKQMEFSMKGHNTLEMYPIGNSQEYRIFELQYSHSTGRFHNVLVFTGEPNSVLKFITKWYKGG